MSPLAVFEELKESQRLLQSAAHEITQLRRRNEILSAQMSVIEVFAAALGLRRSEGASVDIVWEIQHHLDRNKGEQECP